MKIYPADIDAVVERFEGHADVCTFGYEDDPAVRRERRHRGGAEADASDERLRAPAPPCAQHLARHQMPVRWYLVDEIPRTSRGKINRDHIGRQCASLPQIDWRRILTHL